MMIHGGGISGKELKELMKKLSGDKNSGSEGEDEEEEDMEVESPKFGGQFFLEFLFF